MKSLPRRNLVVHVFLFFAITVSACKKIDTSVEKTYVETGRSSGPLGFGGIILTLIPDGKADILFAGDIMLRGTYVVERGYVIVTIDGKEEKFKIISDTELKYEDRVLKLGQK